MKKIVVTFGVFAAFIVGGVVLGPMFVSATTCDHSTLAKNPIVTEICKVVEHELTIRSERGLIRVAILQRGNGELRTLHLHPFSGRENIIDQSIPAEATYVYGSWSDRTLPLEVSTITPLYPKRQ